MNQSIILIGYMGAGKTTLGKALSQNLGTDFCDLDWHIEEQCGKTIPDIFRESGEEGFRQIEREMLHEVIGKKNTVIAVGGGTPCFFDNMDYMNDKAMTVYLKAEIPTLIDHLHMSHTKRPLLEGKTDSQLAEYIADSLSKREPFYSKAKKTVEIQTIHLQEQIDNYVEIIKKITQQ